MSDDQNDDDATVTSGEHVPSFQCEPTGLLDRLDSENEPLAADDPHTGRRAAGRRPAQAKSHLDLDRPFVPCHSTASPSAPIIASRPVMTRWRRARRSMERARIRNPAATIVVAATSGSDRPDSWRVRAEHDDRAYGERDEAAGADHAERADEGLGDHEGKAEQHKPGAGIVDGKHIECEERREQADPADDAGHDGARGIISTTSPKSRAASAGRRRWDW